MLVSDYVKQYTSGERFCFRQIWQEVYKKLPKVIKQLGKFGIGEDKATEAYSKIVQN